MRFEENRDSDVIRASEIGEYVYCHRAWWLGRVQGVPNSNRAELDAGITRHLVHGEQVKRAEWFQRGAWVLFGIAVLGAVVLLARVVGVW